MNDAAEAGYVGDKVWLNWAGFRESDYRCDRESTSGEAYNVHDWSGEG